MILLTTGQTCVAEISLSTDTDVSSEGYFVLSWQSDSSLPLSLQQAATETFAEVSTTALPSEGSLTITGLENGLYFYRVVAADSEQSNTVSIAVRHHSLTRAFGFFSLGLVLFIVLVVTIIKGNAREYTA